MRTRQRQGASLGQAIASPSFLRGNEQMNEPSGFDPFEPKSQRARYAYYQRFRQKKPVVWGYPPHPGFASAVYLLSNEAVQVGLAHPRLLQAPDTTQYQSLRAASFTDIGPVLKSVLFTDPPKHGRLRRPMARHLGFAATARKRFDDLTLLAGKLLRECRDLERFDFVSDFACPYVVTALMQVLGASFGDSTELKPLTAEMADQFDLRRQRTPDTHPRNAANELVRKVENTLDVISMDPDGLASRLDQEYRSGNWTRSDLVANLVFLLFAGQETAVDALGNSVVALASNPAARRQLQTGSVGIEDAIDELLRFDPPLQFATTRVTTESIEICGTVIPADTPVVPVLASANRDEDIFAEADELCLDRQPMASKTFGHGPHGCVGKHMARIEIAAAIGALMKEIPNWSVDLANVRERNNLTFRGHTAIPMTRG